MIPCSDASLASCSGSILPFPPALIFSRSCCICFNFFCRLRTRLAGSAAASLLPACETLNSAIPGDEHQGHEHRSDHPVNLWAGFLIATAWNHDCHAISAGNRNCNKVAVSSPSAAVSAAEAVPLVLGPGSSSWPSGSVPPAASPALPFPLLRFLGFFAAAEAGSGSAPGTTPLILGPVVSLLLAVSSLARLKCPPEVEAPGNQPVRGLGL